VWDDSCYRLSREWGLEGLKISRFNTLFVWDDSCYHLSREWGLNALKISRFKTLFECGGSCYHSAYFNRLKCVFMILYSMIISHSRILLKKNGITSNCYPTLIKTLFLHCFCSFIYRIVFLFSGVKICNCVLP
jgi:hypothetical protein